ncbi:MAG: DNA glycosylase [Eubacteriales bacterium]
MSYSIAKCDSGITLLGLTNFDAAQIFDCGQCFRFNAVSDGTSDIAGIARGRYLRVHTDGQSVSLVGACEDDFHSLWETFLSLDTDYAAVDDEITSAFDTILGREDEVIRRAIKRGSGIRILRQQPWEALISFIISQNNNIPRIKKIISALCEAYGEPIDTPDGVMHTFPTPDAIAGAGVDGIFALKTGFRAKYIIDAANRVLCGECDLDALAKPSVSAEDSAAQLMKINGVGPKVAACVNLFGLSKISAFPVDVWIKRVLARHYPEGLDYTRIGRYAGIAQQYLFYNERWE